MIAERATAASHEGTDELKAASEALASVVDCARVALEGRYARLRLTNGTDLATTGDMPMRHAPGDRQVETPVFREPLVRPDGRRIGALEIYGRVSRRSISPAQATIVQGLSRAALAIIEQDARLGALDRRLQDTFEKSPMPSWIYDPASLRFLEVNEAAVRFYGYSKEQFLRMTVLEIRPPTEHRRMIESVRNRSDLDATATWRHITSNGQPVDVVTHGHVITYNGADAIIVVAIDRTDIQVLKQNLAETQITLDAIVEALPIGLFVKDIEDHGRYMVYNASVGQIVGRDPASVVGKRDVEVFGPIEGSILAAQDRAVMSATAAQIFDKESLMHPDGRARHIRTVKRALPTSDGSPPRYLLGLCEDITERRASEKRIAHMALHDALTDLPNRVQFQHYLDRALKRPSKTGVLALLYLDLDFFKTINDTYGHHTGDKLLTVVGKRLRGGMPRGAMVARLGGDEFAVVARLPGGAPESLAFADRLRAMLNQPIDLGECVAHIDTSIGIALSVRESPESGEALMRHADIALYAAKAEGRGLAKVYADLMSQHVEARQMMSEDLRLAIAEGQFELDYQPLHSLGTDRITGFEALIRWRHPKRGLISPGDFIPVAEQTGLIVPIGEWVLREACLTAVTWPDSVKVAVNLSAVQFRKPGLVSMIERTLAETGLRAERLELEITESVLLTDSGANLQLLHDLRALGARIAMDDFGTGYSSLSYLRSFPFDKIKMDRSFVADVCDNHGSLAIVRAVIGLGSSLSIITTAEGIETPEQFARLKAEGFDELQGYLIGRPMSSERARALAVRQASARDPATAA